MILSYLFALGAIGFFIAFFIDIARAPVTENAAYCVLSALACTAVFISLVRWSDSMERKWDQRQYAKWRGERPQ